MRTLTKLELNAILESHKKWLLGEDKGVKANLSNTDLFGTNLYHANLIGADLSNANLNGANLRGASLSGANLRYANLNGADLRNANLGYANLNGAELRNADLRNAALNWINWHEAKGVKAYVAGLQSSRENAQLTYIPSLDIATTGCWQDNWDNTKKRIYDVYAKGTRERKEYDLAIEYINKQVELDSYEK